MSDVKFSDESSILTLAYSTPKYMVRGDSYIIKLKFTVLQTIFLVPIPLIPREKKKWKIS